MDEDFSAATEIAVIGPCRLGLRVSEAGVRELSCAQGPYV